MTRTGAGLHTPSTPALHITVAQPLAANGWTTDSKLLGQLVDEGYFLLETGENRHAQQG